MSKKVGYAVVGLGVGKRHAEAAANSENANLIAVCDLIQEKLDKIKEAYPDTLTYLDFDEMLKNPDIDAVSIAVPSGMHADFAIKAMKAGKHVLIEKPVDITVEAALRIEQARLETGMKAGVVHQNRYNLDMPLMHDAIVGGRIGRVLFGDFAVKWYRTQEYYDNGGWRGTWEMDGGGSLMNQAVHTVDLMQWLMGDVESVQGHYAIANHEISSEDITTSLIKFKSGAMATFVSTTCCNPERGTFIQVYGADGTIEINGDVLQAWKTVDSTPESAAAMLEKYAKGNAALVAADPTLAVGHKSQVDDMIDAVVNDRDPQVGPMEAVKAVRIINAVYESSRTGKIVYFD